METDNTANKNLQSSGLAGMSKVEINSKISQLDLEFNSTLIKLEKILKLDDSSSIIETQSHQNSFKIALLKQELVRIDIDKIIYELTSNFKRYRRMSEFMFAASLLVSMIGVFFLFTSINKFYDSSTQINPFATSIAALSIIPSIVGALLFVLYYRAIEQYRYFFEKLENALDIRSANLYINSVENPQLLINLQNAFVLNLIKRSSEEKYIFIDKSDSSGVDEPDSSADGKPDSPGNDKPDSSATDSDPEKNNDK